ncbi:class I SAM-dependent methyltransferase [Bradyrhizobium sp. sBnM-33]|uniref:class I SAM-dependent methyltransferase n=1 Tax=Bradyrhizobium sp. sBnM-33 TaxID=2831780 RepID=UPI001BCEB7A1|nr:class I SAM-dependent methyltransferase [Bradyrhizobium sp. sBnM-33]WOH53660.1 class I SAM-dependent methyltransferase [Bradyrhizobium sp. sBnM-33]
MKKAYWGFPIIPTAKNFVRGQYSVEMMRKLLIRLKERIIAPPSSDPMPWLLSTRTSLDDFCKKIDGPLWEESKDSSQKIQIAADAKMESLDIDLGGGGNFPLLYFLVRKMKPSNVVETGVAAGFSSQAILKALKKNGSGRLYSSDLPYFRIQDPEKYIGYVVDDELKENWTCLLKGDRSNLPNILSRIDNIDIFHYDSDKSYSGRKWAIKLILPRMHKGGAVIMDDINDNCYFEDFVKSSKVKAHVFEFHGKYVGLFFVE